MATYTVVAIFEHEAEDADASSREIIERFDVAFPTIDISVAGVRGHMACIDHDMFVVAVASTIEQHIHIRHGTSQN